MTNDAGNHDMIQTNAWGGGTRAGVTLTGSMLATSGGSVVMAESYNGGGNTYSNE